MAWPKEIVADFTIPPQSAHTGNRPCCVNALTMGQIGESYILGHQNLTYRDAFGLMADVMNVAPPRLPLPPALARFYSGQLPPTRLHPGTNKPGFQTLPVLRRSGQPAGHNDCSRTGNALVNLIFPR